MHDGRAILRTRNLLYSDVVGRDACGIGGIAARESKPSHELVQKAVLALCNMEHRGGICGRAGDGAGVTFQLHQPFFREEAKRLNLPEARYLGPDDRLAVGVVFFLDTEPARREAARALLLKTLAGGPVKVLGWRGVPTNPDVLPDEARDCLPGIEQLLLLVQPGTDEAGLERWLYHRRLELRQRLREANHACYVASLSGRLVNYKGLLTSHHLAVFYRDLVDPRFESGLAIFHRRYSTNTYPNWALAQPFRYSCHNGEINTLHTNRNAVHSYSRGLEPPLPGIDLLTPEMSDSASLDEWVEHLILEKNWSLLRALRLSVPRDWSIAWGCGRFAGSPISAAGCT